MKISNINLALILITLLVLPLIISQGSLTNEQLNEIANSQIGKRITFTGFEDLKLNSETKTVTSANKPAKVNLEKIPKDVSEIKYDQGKFIYKFKDGGEISIAKGEIYSVNEGIRYTSKDAPKDIILSVNENSKIIINNEGNLQMEGNSQTTVNNRIFKSTTGENGILEFKGEGENQYFRGKNLDIDTGAVKIKVGKENTDIIFNSEVPDSKQFVRVTGNDEGTTKNIKIVGDDIEVDLKGKIDTDKIKMEVNGEKVLIKINGEKGDKFSFLGRGIIRQTKPSGITIDEITINKPHENMELIINSDGTAVIKNGVQYMNIGGYNDILTNPKAVGTTGSKPDIDQRGLNKPILPDTNFFGIKSPNEIKLFDNIYSIDETQLPNFFNSAKRDRINNPQELAEALVDYSSSNLKIITTAQFNEIPIENFNEGLTQFIEDLNLPGSEKLGLKGDAYAFKNKLISGQKDNIPLGTQIIVLSNKKNTPIAGVVKVIYGGKLHQITLPTSHINRYINNKLSKEKLTRENLFDKFNAHKRTLR